MNESGNKCSGTPCGTCQACNSEEPQQLDFLHTSLGLKEIKEKAIAGSSRRLKMAQNQPNKVTMVNINMDCLGESGCAKLETNRTSGRKEMPFSKSFGVTTKGLW